MKAALSCFLAFLLAVGLCIGADVTFNLKDFVASVSQLQRKTVTVEPRTFPRANGTNIVVAERRYFNTGTNGIFIATNLSEGIYRCYVNGLTWTSVFRINVPSTNGTLTASSLLISQSDGALDTEEGISLDLE